MKIYVETLGCPKNEVDSMMLKGVLKKAGHETEADLAEAEIIIVNTCAFIQDAKEESINTVFELSGYKENNCRLLAVTGCLGQRYNEELFNELTEADIITGVNDYSKIPELIEAALKDGRQHICTDAPECFEDFEGLRAEVKNSSAYLKIAEGCNNRCTYCIIPHIRGKYRSRCREDILKEAEALVENGAEELVLIAQDTTNYGTDMYDDYGLPELLSDLKKIEKLKWIRLMYCYPDKITRRLIEEIRDNPKVCKYIDMPVQHGSNAVLKKMNRRSSKEDIIRVISEMRQEIPEIVIRTTIIVGFPGERAPEFDELYEFVSDMKFDRLGVFSYSKEEGTPAAEIKPQVRSDVKERRREAIMRLQQGISLESNIRKIGNIYEVLVEEGPDEDGGYIGRTQFDASEIDNSVIFVSDRALKPGDFVNVKITDAFDYDLTGEVVK